MSAKQNTNTGAFSALKQDIKSGNPRPLYMFYGEETYLLHYYTQQLRKKMIDPLTEEFNFHRFNDETFSAQAVYDAVENLPMMAERSMVLVEDVDLFKLPEEERSQLQALFEDLPDYCTVVFFFETVAWKPDKRLKKFWSAIEKNAQIVEFAKQSQRELMAWVGRHFASHKKTISSDLCAYLIEITGGTMTALGSEIQKIAAYALGSEITKYDIDAVTEPVLDAVVFEMTDQIARNEYGPALNKLRDLCKMQTEPLSILGAVGAQMRRVSAARTLLDAGRGSGELMQLCGLSDYAARKTLATAGKVPARFCAAAARLVLETDYRIKTSYDDPQRLLELLLLQLSQEATYGKN